MLNPTEHAVGQTLYLETTHDGSNFELEQKIMFPFIWLLWWLIGHIRDWREVKKLRALSV